MDQVVTVHEGTLTAEQEKTYLHLPFEMPPQAVRLEVEYHYSDAIGSNPLLTGGNTLDLGVFDARGIDFLAAGFRGWSGSERSAFFITAEEASPGYLAGPLIPGRWHALLGLYKVAPSGCVYHVIIKVTTDLRVSPPPIATALRLLGKRPSGDLPSSPPRASFSPWLAGELHCHTWHSDGDASPADLVRLSRERGLDFLAISDHNTIASQHDLAALRDPGLILIRGVEATTFKGHFNVWGIPDWVDFRVQRPEDMQAALNLAAERGAVTSCGHPKPFGPPWEYTEVSNYDCIEVWNGPWTLLNQMALEFWLQQLATGRRISAVGGSDYHRRSELAEDPPRGPGTPTVWVFVPGTRNAASVLTAIRQGHVTLSDEPQGPFLDLRAGPDLAAMAGDVLPPAGGGNLALSVHCRRAAGLRLQILDQQGVLFHRVIAADDETIATEIDAADRLYVRAELRNDQEDLRALTNPVYLERAP